MPDLPLPVTVTVDPEPTEDELAAILAAYGQLWPAPAVDAAGPPTSTAWKFSGRWWLRQPRRPVAGARWR